MVQLEWNKSQRSRDLEKQEQPTHNRMNERTIKNNQRKLNELFMQLI